METRQTEGELIHRRLGGSRAGPTGSRCSGREAVRAQGEGRLSGDLGFSSTGTRLQLTPRE